MLSLVLSGFPLLLLVPVASGQTPVTRTIGISAGESVVYSYQILTTYRTPDGNYTTTIYNQFTVDILEVNASRGEVWYKETLNMFNSTTETTQTPVSNVTTIFDPYDNESYLGNIGFYPFTYTDLLPGTGHINITVPLGGLGLNGTVKTGVQKINASVARPSGLIDVNYTVFGFSGQSPMPTVMAFDAMTGLLETGVTKANVFGVEKIFTYHLLSLGTFMTTTSTTTTTTTMTTEPTTITQSTTQTETTTQLTTTSATVTTSTTVTTTASGNLDVAYMALTAMTIVILGVAALAAWVLRGRRP